jgi:hypothetical protein
MLLGTEWTKFEIPGRTANACRCRWSRLGKTGDDKKLWYAQPDVLDRFGLAKQPEVDWELLHSNTGYVPVLEFKGQIDLDYEDTLLAPGCAFWDVFGDECPEGA